MSVSYIVPDDWSGPTPMDMLDAGHVTQYAQEVIYLEGEDNAASISLVRIYHSSISEDKTSMTLLIPDRDRENQEDLVWCIPVDREKWNKWAALSDKFQTCTPEIHGHMKYMNRMEGRDVRTIMLLPTEGQSDEDAIHAGAYLRMVKGLTCRIYVLRSSDQKMSMSTLIHKTAGMDPARIETVEDDGEELQG